MYEKNKQAKNFDKSSKKNFYLAIIGIICLLMSLAVFYPLSMKVDKYNDTVLTIFALTFYNLQGTSFILTIITLIKGIFLIKEKRSTLNYFVLIINGLSFAMFGYEVFWFINQIP